MDSNEKKNGNESKKPAAAGAHATPASTATEGKRAFIVLLGGKAYGPLTDGRLWGRLEPGLRLALGIPASEKAVKMDVVSVGDGGESEAS